MYRSSLSGRARWLALLAGALVTTALFVVVYAVARRAVLDEIRAHAMGVAIATAAAVTAEDLAALDSRQPGDADAYAAFQARLAAVSRYSPDIRYVYIMRRSTEPGAAPWMYEFLVDQLAEDDNRNGIIEPDEDSEPPGTPYDASTLPEMVKAWDAPAADLDVSPDPPYPDLLSGYAPIRNAEGRTVAIVGADVTAGTVRAKLWVLRAVTALVCCAMIVIVSSVLLLYFVQRDLVRERERLLEEHGEALRNVQMLSGLLPICASCKRIRDDAGNWERLETYLRTRSGATFSHGICPECAARLYPEAMI